MNIGGIILSIILVLGLCIAGYIFGYNVGYKNALYDQMQLLVLLKKENTHEE